MTRSNIFKILIISFIVSVIYYLFNPTVIKEGVIAGNLKAALANHHKESLKWADIKQQTDQAAQRVKKSVVGQSFSDWGFLYLVKAPLTEEMVFRGLFVLIPALLLPAQKLFLRINWVNVLLWLMMFIGCYIWATDHDYPHFPEAMVMWGGLINGACIIYAPPTMKGKAIGTLVAIGLHAGANLFYVITFCLLF